MSKTTNKLQYIHIPYRNYRYREYICTKRKVFELLFI